MSKETARERVLKGATLLDSKACQDRTCSVLHGVYRPVPGNWREQIKAKGAALDMADGARCVVGTLFNGGYSNGLDKLGIEYGADYGFADRYGASNEELRDEWLDYVGFVQNPKYAVGMIFQGRWSKTAGRRLDDIAIVGGEKYFAALHGDIVNGKFVPRSNVVLMTAQHLDSDWEALPERPVFEAKVGDLITSDAKGKMWYVGKNDKAWSLKTGSPALWSDLEELIAETPDLKHVQRGYAEKKLVP